METFIQESYIPRLRALKDKVLNCVDGYRETPEAFQAFLNKELKFFCMGTRNLLIERKLQNNQKYSKLFELNFISLYLLDKVKDTDLDVFISSLQKSSEPTEQ